METITLSKQELGQIQVFRDLQQRKVRQQETAKQLGLQMNEREQMSVEMVRTDDLEIDSPAFQHGYLSWLTFWDDFQIIFA